MIAVVLKWCYIMADDVQMVYVRGPRIGIIGLQRVFEDANSGN